MTGQRVAILDGSSSFYATPNSTKSSLGGSSPDSTEVGLRPLPHFNSIVTAVVKKALAAGDIRAGKIARVDLGVICECADVRKLARAIHSRVADVLVAAAGGNNSGVPAV
jgi:mediator of RNA polymerase II transcription subunit 14